MRSLIALSFVCGVTAPSLKAAARPDGNNDRPPPPSMMRSDVQMRMPVDGRGETQAAVRDARPDPWQRAEKPQAERPQSSAQRPEQQSALPLKSDIAQKAHPGDNREVAPKPQALDARVQNAKPATDRMGRPEQKPALPLKTDVMLKMQRDGGDDAVATGGSAAKANGARGAQKMTPHDKEMLCRSSGVCLPQSNATDDVEDKTE